MCALAFKEPAEINDRRVLEDFVTNNPELEELEAILSQFNIFEALGVVRQELRHSDFLAFLLSPSQNHGLYDYFTKRFIQKAVAAHKSRDLPISLVDIDFWDLGDTLILREWNDIDIVIENKPHQFAVIVENKIESTEHPDQLKKYRLTAERHYKGWKLLYLYLTPEGDIPSDEFYIPIHYGVICELIDDLISTRGSTIGPEVKTIISHYLQMLRRHIVSGSTIEDLCRKIYQKHQRALDLLFEYRPDLQASIREYLEETIKATPGLILDHCSKTYIRFIPDKWDLSSLKKGEGWTPSKRMLLFEFRNYVNRLSLALIIGPGPQEIRQKLFEMAQKEANILKPSSKTPGASFCTIFSREFLHRKDYESSFLEDLKPRISKSWELFLEQDLPRIEKVLLSQRWIWNDKN